ncbi:MAG TPA: hypothetical protein VFA59_15830 [Vicinamibacterales bacterium]|nr:hypothetical protein [Vicinamibacterales bacterium]
MAVIAIGAAAAFLVYSERHLTAQVSSLRAFDLHAREAVDAIADLRLGEQAYVAAGQGVTFWMPKVAATLDTVNGDIAALRRSAVSSEARNELDQATSAVSEFSEIDKRARDYLKASQQLMAGDVIFTEGTQTAATAAHHVESARLAEQQAFDLTESGARRQQAMAAGAAAGLALLAVVSLVSVGRRAEDVAQPSGVGATAAPQPSADTPPPTSNVTGALMKAAADLATDVGRARDFDDLARLIGRAAELMEAKGVVVWVGGVNGVDLKPVLAHGYPPQLLARMPSVPRGGDNAAAKAYRTGTLQIVLSRPGESNGALVAPILTADGCIGAVSAEIKGGGEASEPVQSVAVLFAAQLANVIGTGVQEVQVVQGVQEVQGVHEVQEVPRARTS